MKIALTSDGKEMDDQLDERFGRCTYFIIVDSETNDFNVIDNSSAMNHGEDTGINTARNHINRNVNVLITKNIGPRAFAELDKANIEIYHGTSGTIREMVTSYTKGDLCGIKDPIVDTFYGLY